MWNHSQILIQGKSHPIGEASLPSWDPGHCLWIQKTSFSRLDFFQTSKQIFTLDNPSNIFKCASPRASYLLQAFSRSYVASSQAPIPSIWSAPPWTHCTQWFSAMAGPWNCPGNFDKYWCLKTFEEKQIFAWSPSISSKILLSREGKIETLQYGILEDTTLTQRSKWISPVIRYYQEKKTKQKSSSLFSCLPLLLSHRTLHFWYSWSLNVWRFSPTKLGDTSWVSYNLIQIYLEIASDPIAQALSLTRLPDCRYQSQVVGSPGYPQLLPNVATYQRFHHLRFN